MTLMLPSQDNYIATYKAEQIATFKQSIAKDCTDAELNLLLYVVARTGLDPHMKQIYAIVRKSRQKDGSYKSSMTIQTGIDGFRLIAERTGKYSPGREPYYEYDTQGKLTSATAYVKKMTPDGTWHEIGATAFWAEYVQLDYNKNPTSFWLKMPKGQLAKCAEAIALRKAFPGDFNQLYSTEEMEQAKNEQKAEENNTLEAVVKEIEEPMIIAAPDLYVDEIDAYLETWGTDQYNFRTYMTEVIAAKPGWNNRRAIEVFKANMEQTTKSFNGWMMAKVGI
jgi:phage recombination protein Bet